MSNSINSNGAIKLTLYVHISLLYFESLKHVYMYSISVHIQLSMCLVIMCIFLSCIRQSSLPVSNLSIVNICTMILQYTSPTLEFSHKWRSTIQITVLHLETSKRSFCWLSPEAEISVKWEFKGNFGKS